MIRIRPTTWARDSTSPGDEQRSPRKDESLRKERRTGLEQRVEQVMVQEVPGRFARRDLGRTSLRILFLTSVHNSMSQRAYVELTRLGHEVSIGLATSKRAMLEAVERRKPLAEYRKEELVRMRESFRGPDPSYHEARRRFVHKLAPVEPARDLAAHAQAV